MEDGWKLLKSSYGRTNDGGSTNLLQVPVVKGTSGFVFLSNLYEKKEYPCIRCRRCIDACPMRLFPNAGQVFQYQAFDEAKRPSGAGLYGMWSLFLRLSLQHFSYSPYQVS